MLKVKISVNSSEHLTAPLGFFDRWIYRKIKQAPLFSQIFQIAADFALKCVLWRHRNAHSVKERLFLSFKNWIKSFTFSSCPIYKSYIGQTNRKRNESALLVWATDRLSARTGAAGCSRSRDTVIHSAGRYSEESSRIHCGITNISVKSCEKHSAQNYSADQIGRTLEPCIDWTAVKRELMSSSGAADRLSMYVYITPETL